MAELSIQEHKYWAKGDEAPKSLVIMLHGLGADGKDLIGLAHYFAQSLPDTAFVSPDAPFPCDMAPMGHQWFSLQDRSPEAMLRGASHAAGIVYAYIDAKMKEYNLPANKIALLGFSQGTMMSLYVAPRREQQLAAVLGYSGALLGAELLESAVKSKPPVHLIHGTDDDVVPFAVMEPAAKILSAQGFSVDATPCEGTGHGIDETGVMEGQKFLLKHLK